MPQQYIIAITGQQREQTEVIAKRLAERGWQTQSVFKHTGMISGFLKSEESITSIKEMDGVSSITKYDPEAPAKKAAAEKKSQRRSNKGSPHRKSSKKKRSVSQKS